MTHTYLYQYNYVILTTFIESTISDGTFTVNLSADDIPVNLEMSICDALSYIDRSCPLNQGKGTFNVTQTIPFFGVSVSNCDGYYFKQINV